MTKESPYYTNIYFRENFPLKNMFNLTMTYHHDSDVPMLYGYKRRLQMTMEDRMLEQTDMENRTLPVLWMVSHAHAPSGRDDYVAELERYIRVDVFGRVVKRPVKKGDETEELYSKYYFMIAFENAICKDYITEKVWNPLLKGLIPIVLGGVDYKKLLPPDSYIDVLDFKSPRHLADHLTTILRNNTLYEGYFAWRSKYSIEQNKGSWFPVCELCKAVSRSQNQVVMQDLTDLYTYEKACQTKEQYFRNISVPLRKIDYFSREIASQWIGI